VSRVASQALLTAAMLACAGGTARAQLSALGPEVFAGIEVRTIRFERVAGITRLSQVAIPVGAVLPFGRFTLDLGTSWVESRMVRADDARASVAAFTDTQLRGSYVFGQDAVVATLVFNLPTGLQEASLKDYTVIGVVSPSLLGFPVATYASGFSVTSGLAASVPAGDWSVGLAGSLRVNSQFTPYADSAGPIIYKPGVEGRVRGAVDGLIGSSRLAVGFTYSTFGDDHFGKTPAVRGQYSPGPRWLAEAMLVAPVGGSTLSVSLWNFRRTAGDTTGGSARNKETLAAAEISVAIPLSRSVVFEPAASGRASKPEIGKGRLVGAGAGLRIQLGEWISFAPTVRYDTGWIEGDGGIRQNMEGGYFSGFVRISF
jgi:hypothetical protein